MRIDATDIYIAFDPRDGGVTFTLKAQGLAAVIAGRLERDSGRTRKAAGDAPSRHFHDLARSLACAVYDHAGRRAGGDL
jgi:hypothetical protein